MSEYVIFYKTIQVNYVVKLHNSSCHRFGKFAIIAYYLGFLMIKDMRKHNLFTQLLSSI
jgi:hypothetical protein